MTQNLVTHFQDASELSDRFQVFQMLNIYHNGDLVA